MSIRSHTEWIKTLYPAPDTPGGKRISGTFGRRLCNIARGGDARARNALEEEGFVHACTFSYCDSTSVVTIARAHPSSVSPHTRDRTIEWQKRTDDPNRSGIRSSVPRWIRYRYRRRQREDIIRPSSWCNHHRGANEACRRVRRHLCSQAWSRVPTRNHHSLRLDPQMSLAEPSGHVMHAGKSDSSKATIKKCVTHTLTARCLWDPPASSSCQRCIRLRVPCETVRPAPEDTRPRNKRIRGIPRESRLGQDGTSRAPSVGDGGVEPRYLGKSVSDSKYEKS